MKVYGNGEWHARKHAANKRRTWRKLHLAVDTDTHQIVAAELSTVSAGGAYDTLGFYAEVAAKKAKAVTPLRYNAQLWEDGHAHNRAVILTKHIGSYH
nr:transposase [Pseudoalteromonas sp. McH1-42]